MFERPFLPGIHTIPVEPAVAESAWDDALADLRIQFLREAVPKLASVGQLIDHLSVQPTDEAALHELHRRFHGFAGTGSSYGLPKVSLHAARGEMTCASLLEGGCRPGRHHVAEWRVIKDSLESAFAGAEASATLDRHAVAAATPLDVLILDDDPNLCRIAARVFEHEGMRVRTAAGETEALGLVDERLPDCILVDVCLSEGSGYGFIEKLRARPDGESPAVLVISVRNDFQGRVHSRHRGSRRLLREADRLGGPPPAAASSPGAHEQRARPHPFRRRRSGSSRRFSAPSSNRVDTNSALAPTPRTSNPISWPSSPTSC